MVSTGENADSTAEAGRRKSSKHHDGGAEVRIYALSQHNLYYLFLCWSHIDVQHMFRTDLLMTFLFVVMIMCTAHHT